MTHRLSRWAVMLLAGGLLIGCASNEAAYEAALKEGDAAGTGIFRQETLPPQHRPAKDSNEAALWKIMDDAEQTLRLSGKTIKDRELHDYLKGLVCRLAPDHCEDIRIYLTRRPAFNAFMASNGMLEIWNGLFLRIQNEAQLAAILGHELGHYLRRHALQRYETIRLKRGAMTVLSVATSLAGIPLATDVADLFTSGGVMAYERDQEREADGLGVKLMVQAGYHPAEAARLWGLVAELSLLKAEPGEAQGNLFASHPVSAERSAELERLAQRSLEVLRKDTDPPLETGRERWQAMLQPRRSELLHDESQLTQPEVTARLLERMLEGGAGHREELLFYLGDSYRRRNSEGDRERSLTALRQALQEGYSGQAILQVSSAICLRPDRPQEMCAELGRAVGAVTPMPSVPDRYRRRYHRPHPADAKPEAVNPEDAEVY